MEKNNIVKKTADGIKIDVSIMKEILEKFGSSGFATYATLLSFRDDATNLCNPTIDQIRQSSNMGRRTVVDYINKLYEDKFIDIDSGSKHEPNRFYFPKENFYKDWLEDYDQSHASRRKCTKYEQKLVEKIAGIYLITNTVTNKKYVGQATDVRTRWVQHIRELRKGKHYNKDLQADFNKYGEDAFDFKVLEIVEDSPVLDIELDRKENKWGKEYNVLEEGYNKADFIDPFK